MHPKHVADLVQIPMFVIAIKYENFGAWIVPAFVGGNPYLTISAAFTAQAERRAGCFDSFTVRVGMGGGKRVIGWGCFNNLPR